jgi:hypothetical protein
MHGHAGLQLLGLFVNRACAPFHCNLANYPLRAELVNLRVNFLKILIFVFRRSGHYPTD